ncbi:TIGR04219 family outer membrane beta-barrel protein [Aliiglaciecola sp. 3_MG-2023]|uniref:TIGR04219 family outer membrane beta-barrel protein n=1 Tax=Aliiglaciecola sp. 3_MG-2023 TaxID=3062644 RepID=UPI0026E37D42|nr:TIGR04219 family outer membrane beta-barrel protein [Aliiglaciecola sp. 3_MG-2023]MDO6692145.1 TIGR04219 family outer membrane beta-barrel protein [Aliiglaciecola sp. 3_MG-2023]
MKHRIKSLVLAASVVAVPVQADTLLGLYVGAQGWNMDTEGGFANDANITRFDFDTETKSSFYVALEHPIPLIPNIKVRQTTLDTSGDVTLNSTFTFNGEIFSVDTPLTTEVDMSNTDFILYYELFDNDLISFDFGINGKYVDGEIFVRETADTSNFAREEFSGVVPMVYSKLYIGLPFTGLGAYAEGSYLAIDDHSLSDYEIALVYQFVDNLAIDMTLQLGYRATSLELEDLDDIYSDLEFSGAFAGIEIHF